VAAEHSIVYCTAEADMRVCERGAGCMGRVCVCVRESGDGVQGRGGAVTSYSEIHPVPDCVTFGRRESGSERHGS
jgi:hypothetical protein